MSNNAALLLPQAGEKRHNLVMATFLLGVLIGSLDSGIVTPARHVIEQSMGVAPNVGLWVITAYNLIYAVSMPITGKLSDIYGRGVVFRWAIAFFGLGSLIAGLANFSGGMSLLLFGRTIQALGGGGIMPVATAEIGHSFPPDKMGRALGLVGGVFGVGTMLGPTAGSAILSAAGQANWGWVFLINLPLVILILAMGRILTSERSAIRVQLDLAGGVLAALLIFSVMYGLTNFKLSHPSSFLQLNVWPFILAGLVIVPLFVAVERKAVAPIINMALFSNRQTLLTLGISTLTGACMMGIIFVPQWAENVLKISAGTGGYIVTAMSIFSGIAAPMSGVLVDRIGPCRVLLFGFILNIVSLLLMATWVHNLFTMMIALALIGFGIGFTMGSPLNYLMLKQVQKSEAGASLAILSLFRSVGTVLSPSLMVGFLTEAGTNLLPALKAKVGVFALMPDVAGSGSSGMGRETLELLQTADVTNIVDRLCSFMGKMPGLPSLVKATIVQQIRFAGSSIEVVFQSVLNQAFQRLFLTTALLAGLGVLFTVWLLIRKNEAEPIDATE